ncbi:hypothetical protein [Spirillospora sp. CA-294931]|uniref:hypothetical protein n=1 Tax=Spirillospora sp. CA-294931 TaxID=3240042 RepID=UPI003D8D9333
MSRRAGRITSYVANQFGAGVRAAMVASGRSWIYLRDARLDQASATAERSYRMIEPRYGDRDLPLLATYGWHVTFAAVVAARDGNVALADDLLSQGHAVAARMGQDVSVNGTAFGPATVQAQAVGIQVSTGRPAKALETYAAIGGPEPGRLAPSTASSPSNPSTYLRLLGADARPGVLDRDAVRRRAPEQVGVVPAGTVYCQPRVPVSSPTRKRSLAARSGQRTSRMTSRDAGHASPIVVWRCSLFWCLAEDTNLRTGLRASCNTTNRVRLCAACGAAPRGPSVH